jgi:hypothetical protein
MPSLQQISSRGKKYWRIVESRRVNGKPRPIPICYLGSIEHILEVFEKVNHLESKSAEQKMVPPVPPISRLDKTLTWLSKSRDCWKTKCQSVKASLKVKVLAVKRLIKNRSDLKARLAVSQTQTSKLNKDLQIAKKKILELESQLASKEELLVGFKKK